MPTSSVRLRSRRTSAPALTRPGYSWILRAAGYRGITEPLVDKYSANAADSATVVVLARGFLVARRLVVRVVVAAGVVSLLVAPVVRVPLAPSTAVVAALSTVIS